MHTRLISILTAVENSLVADDPSPDEGSWLTARTVNYHAGIANMNLSVKGADGVVRQRGTINVQGFRLADDTVCLKAILSWHGSEQTTERSIYEKPGVDWAYESRRIAAEWAGGPPVIIREEPEAPVNQEPAKQALA